MGGDKSPQSRVCGKPRGVVFFVIRRLCVVRCPIRFRVPLDCPGQATNRQRGQLVSQPSSVIGVMMFWKAHPLTPQVIIHGSFRFLGTRADNGAVAALL